MTRPKSTGDRVKTHERTDRPRSVLASLQPELQEGVFVFVSQGPDSPTLPDDLTPIMHFREQEG